MNEDQRLKFDRVIKELQKMNEEGGGDVATETTLASIDNKVSTEITLQAMKVVLEGLTLDFQKYVTNFERKQRGISIDLTNSIGVAWGVGYPFTITGATYALSGNHTEQISIVLGNKQTITTISDLANLLNESLSSLSAEVINYTASGTDTNLLITDEKLLASNLTLLTLNTSLGTLEYDATSYTIIYEDYQNVLNFIYRDIASIRNSLENQDLTNWEFNPQNIKTIIYYTSVTAENPSGNKNIQFIRYTRNGSTTRLLTQTFAYDIDDDIISITAT